MAQFRGFWMNKITEENKGTEWYEGQWLELWSSVVSGCIKCFIYTNFGVQFIALTEGIEWYARNDEVWE
jgi:hypothetical protein